jgi:hypothetical protein
MRGMKFLKVISLLLIINTIIPVLTFSQTWEKRASVNLNENCGGYWEYLPAGYNLPENANKKYPTIIFLNGASEAGSGSLTDLDKMVKVDPWITDPTGTYLGIPGLIDRNLFPATFTVNGNTHSFIVLALQCVFNGTVPQVEQYINYFFSNYRIDTRRAFLTGISIGGTRVWTVGGTNKSTTEKFAALIPIDGGADYNYRFCRPPENFTCTVEGQQTNGTDFFTVVNNLSPVSFNTPRVIAIHGATDFNLRYGEDYVNQIKLANPENSISLFTFPGEHGSWKQAYDPNIAAFSGLNLYQWMLAQADILLPITLTSFDAISKNKAVELTWNTESESNSSHFAVERSSNGREFKEIGRVNASRNSTTSKNYRFTDNSPLTGNNYYRLKMVDLDATFKYSELRRVSMNGSDLEFSFGPNPVTSEANIRITGNQRTRLNITVTDLMGRTLKSMSFSKTDIVFSQKINLAELPAGQYILSVKGDNVNYTQRIMKR